MLKLIPGICTHCNATLSVDQSKDAMICPYCNTPFITQKAIQLFKSIYNVTGQKVVVEEKTNDDFEVIGGVLVKYRGTKTDVVIPEGISKLGDSLFEGMMITSIKIPDSVTVIGDSVFRKCVNLEKIVLPNKLVSIGVHSLTEFKELVIPSSVEEIQTATFAESNISSTNKKLETLYVSKRVFNKLSHSNIRFSNLVNIYVDGEVLDFRDNRATMFSDSLIYKKHYEYERQIEQEKARKEEQKKIWKKMQRCQHCGGQFKGFLIQTCTQCGEIRDYG